VKDSGPIYRRDKAVLWPVNGEGKKNLRALGSSMVFELGHLRGQRRRSGSFVEVRRGGGSHLTSERGGAQLGRRRGCPRPWRPKSREAQRGARAGGARCPGGAEASDVSILLQRGWRGAVGRRASAKSTVKSVGMGAHRKMSLGRR